MHQKMSNYFSGVGCNSLHQKTHTKPTPKRKKKEEKTKRNGRKLNYQHLITKYITGKRNKEAPKPSKGPNGRMRIGTKGKKNTRGRLGQARDEENAIVQHDAPKKPTPSEGEKHEQATDRRETGGAPSHSPEPIGRSRPSLPCPGGESEKRRQASARWRSDGLEFAAAVQRSGLAGSSVFSWYCKFFFSLEAQ
jgi:hypothetical protein